MKERDINLPCAPCGLGYLSCFRHLQSQAFWVVINQSHADKLAELKGLCVPQMCVRPCVWVFRSVWVHIEVEGAHYPGKAWVKAEIMECAGWRMKKKSKWGQCVEEGQVRQNGTAKKKSNDNNWPRLLLIFPCALEGGCSFGWTGRNYLITGTVYEHSHGSLTKVFSLMSD